MQSEQYLFTYFQKSLASSPRLQMAVVRCEQARPNLTFIIVETDFHYEMMYYIL